MSGKKKVQKVALSPIGEYCEAMREALRLQGKELSADIGKALSMMQEADRGFLKEYGYLDFCVRTGVRLHDFDLIQVNLKNRLEELFAGIAAYGAALDAVLGPALPRGEASHDK